jgi:hypothetical protein
MATATLVPIATQTLGGAAASITFSSIPGTYTDLRLVITGTVATSAGTGLCLQLNGDTATNYSDTHVVGSGATTTAYNNTSGTKILFNGFTTISTTVPGMWSVDLMSYAGSTNKTVLVTQSLDLNGSGDVEIGVGLWRSTAAITSIKIFEASGVNLATGTIATLWGI